jgi:hypothetical protein
LHSSLSGLSHSSAGHWHASRLVCSPEFNIRPPVNLNGRKAGDFRKTAQI